MYIKWNKSTFKRHVSSIISSAPHTKMMLEGAAEQFEQFDKKASELILKVRDSEQELVNYLKSRQG